MVCTVCAAELSLSLKRLQSFLLNTQPRHSKALSGHLLGADWTAPGYIERVGNLSVLSGLRVFGMPLKNFFSPLPSARTWKSVSPPIVFIASALMQVKFSIDSIRKNYPRANFTNLPEPTAAGRALSDRVRTISRQFGMRPQIGGVATPPTNSAAQLPSEGRILRRDPRGD